MVDCSLQDESPEVFRGSGHSSDTSAGLQSSHIGCQTGSLRDYCSSTVLPYTLLNSYRAVGSNFDSECYNSVDTAEDFGCIADAAAGTAAVATAAAAETIHVLSCQTLDRMLRPCSTSLLNS